MKQFQRTLHDLTAKGPNKRLFQPHSLPSMPIQPACPRRLAILLMVGVILCTASLLNAQSSAPSLADINVENSPLVDDPWGGVESATGDLIVPQGHQMQVSEEGRVRPDIFSPSVSVGDLNGDGRLDLVVADARGFIWFFPNKGTKTNPVFGQGEVMPVWFGSEELRKNSDDHCDVVPRLQLIDFNQDGKLDLVVGTSDGSLYMLPNTGSSSTPNFRQPSSLDIIRVPTRSRGVLWCNYLAPFLYDWEHNGVLDLIMGEGTYSANSIYLLRNKGSNDSPAFNESTTLKIIPGMGREHLTPCVVDWNGDGKPDVICGERQGYIDLFLNTTTDPLNPTFTPSHVRIAGQEKFGQLTTVTVADLSGNKLPNLVFSDVTGRIMYAVNSGQPGNPQFNSPAIPLKGKSNYPKIYKPHDWGFGGVFGCSPPYGNSYELAVATSADVEPGFTPPTDHQGKFALRAYVVTPQNTIFNTRYFYDPSAESDYNIHALVYKTKLPIQTSKRYRIIFNVKTDGEVTDTDYHLSALHDVNGSTVGVNITKPYSASSDWSKITDTFSWETTGTNPTEVINMTFTFRWHGTGSIYLDDLSIKKDED